MASKRSISFKGTYSPLKVAAASAAILLACLYLAGRLGPQEWLADKPIGDKSSLSDGRPWAGAGSAPAGRRRTGVRERLEQDAEAGRALVVHVVVALCDNKYQGIVPVPEQLGNGQDPRNNLYWGAMYGVRSFMTRSAGWRVVAKLPQLREGILEKIVLHKRVGRGSRTVDVYAVAEAWDGKEIRSATKRFLQMAAGRKPENIKVETVNGPQNVTAGGASHLISYIGHNGLMDFSLDDTPRNSATAKPRSAIALACKSKPYFQKLLAKAGAHGLLLTTGFMAPEAYTLDAAICSWAVGEEPSKVREKAAQAYNRYQKCGVEAAKRLFFSEPHDAKNE
jgi:hypothetical protein